MSPRRTLPLPVLTLSLTMMSLLCISSPASADEGYEIEQVDALAGTQRILATPKAVRIENLANRFVILARAPDWKVSAFNPHARTLYQSELAPFKGHMCFGTNVFGSYLDALPLNTAKKVIVPHKGMLCEKRTATNPHPDRTRTKRGGAPTTIFGDKADIEEVYSWHWKDPLVPSAAGKLLTKLYRLPIVEGVPLRFQYKTVEDETTIELKTNSIKKVSIDPALFELPAKCRIVKTELEVTNDKRRKKAVERLVDNWDDWGKIVDTEGKTKQHPNHVHNDD